MTAMASSAATLQTQQLGNSDLHITTVGFGASAIGGGNREYVCGAQDDNESLATIERALDLGINWIDTMAIYSLGHSEQVVGASSQNTATKPHVFNKCFMRLNEDRSIYRSLKADSLRQEFENSFT